MNKQTNREISRRLDEQGTNRRTEEDGEMSGDTFMSTILIAFFLELDRRKILWKIMINSKREVIYWNSHWLKKMKKTGKIYLIVAYLKKKSFQKSTVRFQKRPQGVIFLTKTPIMKPFLTSDQKEKMSMLKSGIRTWSHKKL